MSALVLAGTLALGICGALSGSAHADPVVVSPVVASTVAHVLSGLRADNARLEKIIAAQNLLRQYLAVDGPVGGAVSGRPGGAVYLPLSLCDEAVIKHFCHQLDATFGGERPRP